MCNEIYFNVILFVTIEIVLQCCDFNIFTGWIDRKYKNTGDKEITDGI
jgi:hypothetical protein